MEIEIGKILELSGGIRLQIQKVNRRHCCKKCFFYSTSIPFCNKRLYNIQNCIGVEKNKENVFFKEIKL